MKWSWKLGTFAGIGVYIHATFTILIAWVVMSQWSQTQDLLQILGAVLFVLALFACVVLHEFGHALTARRFGISTRDITLLPIGGVARLEKMPDKPWEEFLVAIAGPAVNVVIAALLYVALVATGSMPQVLDEASLLEGSIWLRLMLVNITLVLFNLLPAFPMDGGRVLRAVLAMRMDYVRATQIAASVGQGMALLFGFAGFFLNPVLLFIALFVWIGAEQEAAMAQYKFAFSGTQVEEAMLTEFHILSPHDSLDRAVEFILAGTQQDFPVLETVETGFEKQQRVVGVLTRARLMGALAKREDLSVGEVMETGIQTAQLGEPLDAVVPRLQSAPGKTMAVMAGNRLAGLLTTENVGEFLMIRSAMDGRASTVPVALRTSGD